MSPRTSLAVALGAIIAALAVAPVHAQVTYQSGLEYDELGRVIRVLAADGSVKFRYGYDAGGNRTSSTDALGRTTTFAYDALGRMVESVDPTGAKAQFTYDAADRITQIVDPLGHPTRYHYDGMGRLVREESPDRGVTQYAYNDAGQLLQKTLADGSTLSHEYDGLGRLVRQGGGVEWRTHVYDVCTNGKGRWCESLTAVTQVGVEYTQAGQVELKHERIEGDEIQTGFAWDQAGRLVGIAYPSGTFVGYNYVGGKLEGVYATVGGTTTPVIKNIASAPFGGATSWDYGNGLQRTINLDRDGRVTGLGVADASTARQSLTYQRNAADEITRITNGLYGALTMTNAFDAASRLTASHAAARESDFTLDANGNRVAYREGAESYSIQMDPQSNRILGATGARQSSLEYDANGNLVRLHRAGDADTYFAYDRFQRLAQVVRDGSDGSAATHYMTNAVDQRVMKQGADGAIRFTYMGQNHLLAEQTSAGWKDYIRVDGALVGMVDALANLYFVHDDHLGRPEALTDSDRNIRWRAANFAFNRQVLVDTVGGMNLGFPGQYWDGESQMWSNGYRYYLSEREHGWRYTQPDPIGMQGGLNIYSYVDGNPVMWVDPYGLFCISPRAKAAISGAAAGAASGALMAGLPGALGGAVLGGTAGYAFGDNGVGAGAVTGAASAAYATGTVRGAAVGAVTGGLAGVEASALIGGTMGALEGATNSPKTYFSKTHWSATAGPAIKGAKGGVIGWAASATAEALVDLANDQWGDCGCGR